MPWCAECILPYIVAISHKFWKLSSSAHITSEFQCSLAQKHSFSENWAVYPLENYVFPLNDSGMAAFILTNRETDKNI